MLFFFSSRRRHTRFKCDWSSDVCSSDLGWDKVRLTAPVFAGDTLYAESEVIGKRESASRPHHGIVTVRTTGRKADGTVFMTFERAALIPMRGHAVDDRLDY